MNDYKKILSEVTQESGNDFKTILRCIRLAFEYNQKNTPEINFSRDRYREISSELNLPVSSYKIEQNFNRWHEAVTVATGRFVDDEGRSLTDEEKDNASYVKEVPAKKKASSVKEISYKEEDDVPLITKKTVSGDYKVLVFPDIHVPYHAKKAIEVAIRLGEEFQPDEIVCLGDLLDCYTLSTYSRSTNRQGDLAAELKMANELLDEIKTRTGAKEATFIEGNHEARIRKFVLNKCPELVNLDILSVNNLLGLEKIGWDFIPERKFYQINNLFFTHGEFANMHSAKKHIDEYRVDIIHGHTHRISSRYHRGLDKTVGGFELGFLGSFEVAAEFTKRANWQHGIGTAIISGDKHWVSGHHIQNNCVAYGNKIIRVD
jgi:predicted phosphodiesterase